MTSRLDFRPGDVVTLGNLTVQSTHYGFDNDQYLSVATEGHANLTVAASLVRMVKRGKRTPPKPAVGDLIDGNQVRATQWKRGTAIRVRPTNYLDGEYVFDETGYLLHLGADGFWHYHAAHGDDTIAFEHLASGAKFEVIHLPG